MNNATKEQIAAAFTEWERRYREDPRAFQTDYERFSAGAETYGDAAAPYFLKLLAEFAPAIQPPRTAAS